MNLNKYEFPKTKLNQFNKAGIYTDMDLLKYFPKNYIDYGFPVNDYAKLNEKSENCKCAILGKIIKIATHPKCFSIVLTDNREHYIRFFCFNQYIIKEFREQEQFLITGSIRYNAEYNNWSGTMEHYYPYDPKNNSFRYFPIQPVYKPIKGMSDDYLRKSISYVLDNIKLKDYPEEFRKKFSLCEIKQAFVGLHFPVEKSDINAGRYRIKFDTIFSLCCYFQQIENQNDERCLYKLKKEETEIYWKQTENKLPFSLTHSQKQAMSEIMQIFCSGNHLEALVQGDVGSGKTMVALFSAIAVYKNGYQAAVIAPTEVLATQHFEEFKKYCDDVLYLSGSTKAKEKKKIYSVIESGKPCIIIGTHSLMQTSVPYKNLALAVIDEEHKFGVIQRNFIRNMENIPHIISMSATPIPRTMAISMNQMGVNVYNIESPASRLPVKTEIVPIKDSYKLIDKEIKDGHQAYIICSLIESDNNDIQSINNEFAAVNTWFKDKPYAHPCMINGKMKKDDINNILEDFRNNKYNILISTTIVEVGVNVPNATVMLIKNSERFGLSQMHQLRGRVGRGNLQSYCLLATDNPTERDKALCRTNNGFQIAEEDLILRGAGDFLGTRQSGISEAAILLQESPELLEVVRNEVRDIFYSGYEDEYAFAYKQDF